MTAAAARAAFGAEFVGAAGFLNSPTYGLPPRFLVDALHECIGKWQAGTRVMTPHAANWYGGEEPWQSIYGLPLRLAPARCGWVCICTTPTTIWTAYSTRWVDRSDDTLAPELSTHDTSGRKAGMPRRVREVDCERVVQRVEVLP